MDELLKIKDLDVQYDTDEGAVYAVSGLNLTLKRGEAMGLVGETGAGKTTSALSILGILPEKIGRITSGEIFYHEKNLLTMTNKEKRRIRGKQIAMIFQDPMTSLNPIISVGEQILEMLELHRKDLTGKKKLEKVDEILRMVGIPPERKNEYPFQFSGGMKQRIGIAMALVCAPELLIADEPTTALDVTIQAQILDLMKQLKREYDSSIIMITHDLGIVAEVCETVSVMYGGEIIESGTVEDVYRRDKNHPYTEGLFNCIPRFDSTEKRLTPIEGFMFDPMTKVKGCRFADRCPYCMPECRKEAPSIYQEGSHFIRCRKFSNPGRND